MKEMRINLAVGQNRGLTLVELLVAIAIGTAIMGVMSMSIASIMKITPLNNDRVITLNQVQNAGYWVSRDVLMAQVVDPEPSANVLMHLEWDEWDGTHKAVDYVFDGDELRRVLNDDSPGMLIARYVVAADTRFEAVSGNSTYRLTIKAAKDAPRPIQKIYHVTTRLSN
ncbi:MAG: prepilin-type N-terminal cleavage/methylation domain-containing protein [Chloroflexi bacterium]|nr:prepilin-type N-terminal cleavage/methylation domain-containing protein [Chloroflexota bacterium]